MHRHTTVASSTFAKAPYRARTGSMMAGGTRTPAQRLSGASTVPTAEQYLEGSVNVTGSAFGLRSIIGVDAALDVTATGVTAGADPGWLALLQAASVKGTTAAIRSSTNRGASHCAPLVGAQTAGICM